MSSNIDITPEVSILVAMNRRRVIGDQGGIPWRHREDQQRFKALTMGHTVLMGRKTYDSLPEKVRPLPGRFSVVVTHRPDSVAVHPAVETVSDPVTFVEEWRSGRREQRSPILWVMGGETVYRATLPLADSVELTLIDGDQDGDTFFPEFETDFELVRETAAEGARFLRYERKRK